MENIAKNLKQLREDKGIAKSDLVTYLGITESSYNRFEAGSRIPSLELLIKLKTYFKVSLDDLVSSVDDTSLVDRELVVSYKDLLVLDLNTHVAHGLVKQVYHSYESKEIPKASLDDKVKFVYKKDVITLCNKIIESLK
ncbi:helix-turn-helix domain-containing protein [Streptococcus sp. zg-JUN1979]|uniref:helix-turn-helix domain-containing protein n=1 Tax=Streptococcus sp. zg-JUN1979 TaxID=3391450 RepID=UPI0039A5FDA7